MSFDLSDSWSLLSPEASPRLEAARVAQQARLFFGTALIVPSRELAERDSFAIELVDGGAVEVTTAPLAEAPEILAAAHAGVRAIGGAGFDALVARARRAWIVRGGAEDRAALLIAAVLASVLLAPIVPPGGGTIFGVRGARTRLEALGAGAPAG